MKKTCQTDQRSHVRTRTRARRSAFLLSPNLALSLLSITGCSNSTPYELPHDICGRKIDPVALQPLLPSGQQFEAVPGNDDHVQSTCSISVDNNTALILQEHRGQNRFDVWDFVVDDDPDSAKNPKKAAVGDDTVTTDDWLISMNACTGYGKLDYYILDVILGVKTDEPMHQELEDFAKSYLPEGMKKAGCTL